VLSDARVTADWDRHSHGETAPADIRRARTPRTFWFRQSGFAFA
jgi:hypothetical protein